MAYRLFDPKLSPDALEKQLLAAWKHERLFQKTQEAVRYGPPYRATPEAIRNILLPTPAGGRVPLGQVAQVELKQGAFMIYRENGQRYIPIKFSVRGRDLATTMQDAEARLRARIHLPAGYYYDWAGEYENLQREERGSPSSSR